MYQIDYQKIMLDKVTRLLPVGSRREPVGKYGGTTPTEFGLGINSLCVNESFCATGSDDGILRLWPLDFSTVFLEAGKHNELHVCEVVVLLVATCYRNHVKISQCRTLVAHM